MGIRRHIQAFGITSLLIVISLLGVRLQMGLVSGIGKLVVSLALAALLMFVVARTVDICSAIVVRYLSSQAFLFTVVALQEPVRQILTDDFNPAEPILPSRFQLPPPLIAA